MAKFDNFKKNFTEAAEMFAEKAAGFAKVAAEKTKDAADKAKEMAKIRDKAFFIYITSLFFLDYIIMAS